jgi:ribose transport system ATP-binding protein
MTQPARAGVPGGNPALHISALSKTFAGSRALNDVGFDVRPGEVHALVGENGSGKSTLIKILSGYHLPDLGAVIRVGGQPLHLGSPVASHRQGCRFVHQDLGLVGDLSVADNLSLGVGYPMRLGTISSRRWRREVDAALALVELDIDPAQPVDQLSAAAKTGVAVARALQHDAHGAAAILVLDEPTASLPSPQVAQLHDIVRTVAARGLGVLYVSHHLQEIFDLAETVTVLRDGVRIATRPTTGLDHRTLVNLIVGTEHTIGQRAPQDTATGRVVLTTTGLSRGPLRDFDLQARAGEIVGIAGITGSGRDTVLASVFGATDRDSGTVRVDGTELSAGRPRRSVELGVAYLPPDRKINGGVMTISAQENFSLTNLSAYWRLPMIRRRRERAAAAHWFREFDVRPVDAGERNLETFSGGNQQKVLLAKWIQRSPKVLLLEEPTQGVDIAAKALLHEQVARAARAGACVVVSSADNDELADLCDRVIVLDRGVARAELSGARLTSASVTNAALGLLGDEMG